MLSLFPLDPVWPQGFSYFPNFLSMQEEAALLETVTALELHPLIFQGFEAKRKVASYGYDYNFDKRTIRKGKEIPEGLRPLLEKAAKWLSMPLEDFGEVLVTEYPPGSVINWHRDAPPFDVIVGVSLLEDCQFRFRPYDKARRGKNRIINTSVSRRSLYVLKDEARSDWEHSISPVKKTRYSITLRTLRK